MTTAKKLISAAGAAGAGEATYVDDVFSTYLYEGNGNNGTATSTSTALLGSSLTHNVQFSSDGLYLATHLPDSAVYIWSLSTPYDVSTITSSTNFSYTSQTTSSQSSRLSDDGTKAYVTDSTTGAIFQYNLSTAYDASSASYASKSLSISGQASNPRGIFFKPDGTSLFVTCANNTDIYQYTLSTAWDISTGSYASKSASTGGETNPYNVFFNNTGSIMIVCGSAVGLTEFSLSSAWDVSTASATGTTGNPDTYGTTTLTFAADFADNGTRLVVMDHAVKAGVGDLNTAYDIDAIGDGQLIRNDIDLDDKGGLVWFKNRTTAFANMLFDTERGATKFLSSNSDAAEATDTTALISFNSDGFSINNAGEINNNGTDVVSWSFAKQEGFFDIVTYTGNGTSQTIPHSLGSDPGMILVKRTDSSEDWVVYHKNLDAKAFYNELGQLVPSSGLYLELNETSSISQSNGTWDNTDPTESGFTVGSDANVNVLNGEFVAYLFADDALMFGPDSDESIIKCGSYTGSGVEGSPEVVIGWEPQWLLIKDLGASKDWILVDSMRGLPVGSDAKAMRPNLSSVAFNSRIAELTATGFKVGQFADRSNLSGHDYVYMAIRRPHKPASEFAATDLFDVQEDFISAYSSAGNPVDMVLGRSTSTSQNWRNFARMIGGDFLVPNSNNAEQSLPAGELLWDSNSGFYQETNGTPNIWHQWRRAPGFFDVVAYEGDDVFGHMVNHNLGVVPEMIWIKNRGRSNTDWLVYHAGNTSEPETEGLYLSSSDKTSDSATFWHDTSPTATQFSAGRSSNINNRSGDNYIAYLFASVDGISKVGSYTATGSNLNVDCGFSSGARFVLIKWASDVGPWYLWDSVRGIVSGNDPYLQLNSDYAQTTTTDWIDPLSSGFTITSAAGNDVNNSGGEYIFYAIA